MTRPDDGDIKGMWHFFLLLLFGMTLLALAATLIIQVLK